MKKLFVTYLIVLVLLSSKVNSQKDTMSFNLKISYRNKTVWDFGENVINYSMSNLNHINIYAIINPIIGYKSDNVTEGYFDVEFDSTGKWYTYEQVGSNYLYNSKGQVVILKPNQAMKANFNLSLLYKFDLGKYRVRLNLFKPLSNKTVILNSNWLYFSNIRN